MDLNIENYTLKDLLNLFQLPRDFTSDDLKRAKRLVLKTHPDKSALGSEYFLFFSKAYSVLLHVFQVRSCEKTDAFYIDDCPEKAAAAKKFVESPHFHKEFNALFDKIYIAPEHETEGYGDWLKSGEDLEATFVSRKEAARAIVVKPSVEPISTSLKNGTLGGKGEHYADLKHVYTTGSVVGVSEVADLPPARTAEELKFERGKKINPMGTEEAQRYLNSLAAREGTDDMDRAFHLLRQSMTQEKRVANDFWGHVLRLE